MAPKARNRLLSQPQAACLIVLRCRKASQPKIAIESKLALATTAAALRTLARLGLAKQEQDKRWHATVRGKTYRFETIPNRSRKVTSPGIGGRRLLELLDRPMRGNEIVEQLGMSRQGVRQLLIKLHAQGHVRFADPESPFWIVTRAGDKTSLLSRDEQRVLSAIPREYATGAAKIRLAARVSESKVDHILKRLLLRGFVEATNGFGGDQVYRITDAGLQHPQYAQSASPAQAQRLPVGSDRIRKVLSAIFDSGGLRIIDVTNTLELPHKSMNALMQYLKRKRLVEKHGQQLHAPYWLTAEGLATLAEMTRRGAG